MQQTVRWGNEAEERCVRLAQHGDASATKAIYCQYVRYLAAVCARYVIRDEDLKDILQESFVKIFSSIGRFEYRGEGSLKAWMSRIVVNEALKFLERKSRFTFVSGPWDLPDADGNGDGNDEPDGLEEIPPEIVQEMIRSLPVGYRTVFNLYMFEGRSHVEIASLLKIGESSSASQLSRAKATLARQIREYQKNITTRLDDERRIMEK